MMKRTMMALAAVPVAALLAGGGVAVAQAAGSPPGPAVVRQAECHWQQAERTMAGVQARHGGDHSRTGGRGVCLRDHAEHRQPAQPGSGVMARVHHGEHHQEHHGDR